MSGRGGEDVVVCSEWSDADLAKIEAADELRIATRRSDGTLRPAVPIWVVAVDRCVYVRTWHRRNTGWFGRTVSSGAARIAVPGLEADVTVKDVGSQVRAGIDAAYRVKYGRYGAATIERMVSDDAVATTLRLVCDQGVGEQG
jgi:hypothetical protein